MQASGVTIAFLASPGLLPIAGAGHGFVSILMPAWLIVIIFGADYIWLSPVTTAYPSVVVFFITTGIQWLKRNKLLRAVGAEPEVAPKGGGAARQQTESTDNPPSVN